MLRRLVRSPVTWIVAVLLVFALGVGAYWFAPWKLFTDTEVADEVPVVAVGSPTPGTQPSASPSPVNQVLATGQFVTHEHETSGRVQLVRLADGRRQLVLLGLATSDGPDLRVWLTDRKVVRGTAGWKVFDDGRYLELAKLKGNRGNQVYDVPAGADLAGLRSVSIWCKRFAVSFGAAELTPV